MISRIDIINKLIEQYKYNSYLEIGVNKKDICFNKIICNEKISVDPSNHDIYDFNMSSDDFFKINKRKFDIIFIDGFHEAEQVERDIINSLTCLNSNGTIVVHDTNPPTELHATETQYDAEHNPKTYPYWNGTVWKAIFKLRKTRDDLIFRTYEKDWGVTLITVGKGKILDLENPYFSYKIFAQNRQSILNT